MPHACPHCGYEIAAGASAICSECGRDVTTMPLLRHADAGWAGGLLSALRWNRTLGRLLMFSIVTILLLMVAIGVFHRTSVDVERFVDPLGRLLSFVAMAAAIVLGATPWWITQPEPDATAPAGLRALSALALPAVGVAWLFGTRDAGLATHWALRMAVLVPALCVPWLHALAMSRHLSALTSRAIGAATGSRNFELVVRVGFPLLIALSLLGPFRWMDGAGGWTPPPDRQRSMLLTIVVGGWLWSAARYGRMLSVLGPELMLAKGRRDEGADAQTVTDTDAGTGTDADADADADTDADADAAAVRCPRCDGNARPLMESSPVPSPVFSDIRDVWLCEQCGVFRPGRNRCRDCGYDLRFRPSGVCPECGRPM
ncbi:MAG: zinc ribbon domain-containing protein [Phycisphaerales bacterium]|nr:zinc ribbon domain-containing protein [Phycisphaerales bacterium]